jgi:hypothetical protein
VILVSYVMVSIIHFSYGSVKIIRYPFREQSLGCSHPLRYTGRREGGQLPIGSHSVRFFVDFALVRLELDSLLSFLFQSVDPRLFS